MDVELEKRIELAKDILDTGDLDLLAAYLMSDNTDDAKILRDTQRRLSKMRLRAREMQTCSCTCHTPGMEAKHVAACCGYPEEPYDA